MTADSNSSRPAPVQQNAERRARARALNAACERLEVELMEALYAALKLPRPQRNGHGWRDDLPVRLCTPRFDAHDGTLPDDIEDVRFVLEASGKFEPLKRLAAGFVFQPEAYIELQTSPPSAGAGRLARGLDGDDGVTLLMSVPQRVGDLRKLIQRLGAQPSGPMKVNRP